MHNTPSLLEVIGAYTPAGLPGLTDIQQQSKVTKPKLSVGKFLRAARKGKRKSVRGWINQFQDLFGEIGRTLEKGVDMKSLDMLLLACCLYSLSTLGGKTQDTQNRAVQSCHTHMDTSFFSQLWND